jgi:quinoprotein glucose dehydrogenase
MRHTAAFLIAVTAASAADKNSTAHNFTTWTQYEGGADSSQYSALKQINKSNVAQLQVAWTYPTEGRTLYSFSPIVVDNVLYVLAKNNFIVALDAACGPQ